MTIVIRCYERGSDFDPDYSKLAHVEYIKGNTATECMEIVRKYRTRQYISDETPWEIVDVLD